MFKKQFRYMACAKRSLLCHGLHHNGYKSIICPIFKESENSDYSDYYFVIILYSSLSNILYIRCMYLRAAYTNTEK